MKKIFTIVLTLLFLSTTLAFGNVMYEIEEGDTLWKISNKYNISLNKIISINNIKNVNNIYAGSKISLPELENQDVLYVVKSGDTFWKISNMFGIEINEIKTRNNYTSDYIEVGEVLYIPFSSLKEKKYNITHTVQSGESLWSISMKYGVTQDDVVQVNKLSLNSYLKVGQKLLIPQYYSNKKYTRSNNYGEFLDWWKEAQYLLPINSIFTVKDLKTGKTWNMKRTIGANHADCEPLSNEDTQIMKNIWGGEFSWERRPVLILYNGRKIAASASCMPHDIQYLYRNGANGHFDIHFPNSTRHIDGQRDEEHQYNTLVAAGLR